MREKLIRLYDNPELYDKIHSSVTEDINFYVDMCKGETLELGCGTGRIGSRLPLYTGIDCSEEMLNHCKQKFPSLDVYKSDFVTEIIPDKYDTIIMPCNTLHHLGPLKHFNMTMDNIKNSLREDGQFIFDILNPTLHLILSQMDKKSGGFSLYEIDIEGEETFFTEEIKYFHNEQFMKIIWTLGNKSQIEINMRLYFPLEIQNMLEYNGFKIDKIYGGFDKSKLTENSNHIIIVAKKI